MVTTFIVTFIVLACVAILRKGPGDLLLAKLRPHSRERGDDIRPFLILPVIGEASIVTPSPIAAAESALPVQSTPVPTPQAAADEASLDTMAPVEPLPPRPRRTRARETSRPIPVTPLADTPGGATVVFQRANDRPVQILPGRFKVVSGDPRREDIRFIGQVGTEARLMIGRNVGAPHEVVTLQSLTVSRQHAQLQFADGGWIISNLSETNPVIVNDETLDRVGRTHRLSDGDRVELGEVMLRFHAQ